MAPTPPKLNPSGPGIGLLNEKPLHASLKQWYGQPGDCFEVPVDGFVIDIVRGDRLLEIQTANFSAMKSKLTKLVQSHPVRVIYPIAQEKWLVKLSTDGDKANTRRKSPKKGRVEDVFWEMVRISHLIPNPNFSLEVLLIQEEEVRRFEAKRRWRRNGWCTEERRLLAVVARHLLQTPADWLAFLPQGVDAFTTKDIADAMGIRRELAQKIAYALRTAKLIELIGKRGRGNLYRVAV
ncbi:hypothetical protein [Leptothoe kymatousa]|uniref:DUF8091 domain-containing protein n=1 Tax=Leptothoe kymatousa TAU-MAC 1615 TaxID=2364775 RepID=A0ABS5Y3N3_9CYAN|nr:hypothetical protein [Leptothoe kymatousa]MBT9312427.1 hypothetical protein [Leptothoe kymatousa TAU-MAC 1615]